MEAPIYHLEGVVKAKEEHMEDFVGPLDLILHLLSKNKLEIKDIQIALILDQYMEWMNRRKELDLEVASDFVTMASHLVYIKTRMLLSIHDEEAISAMNAVLGRLDNKLPPPVSAFQGIVGREPYPVADKAGEIIHKLIQFGVTRFRALFKGSRSRSEVVATFLAVLELCKARRLLLAGTESDCTVTCTQEEGAVEFTSENY